MDAMRTHVEAVVADIPVGRVMTYGEVAAASGYPGAARQVGAIASLGGSGLPWHRVVGSAGRISTVGDGQENWQTSALAQEGIIVREGKIVSFGRYSWYPVRLSLNPPIATVTSEPR